MQVTFLGTGEAFDRERLNTSILVEDEVRIAIDCGYSSVLGLLRACRRPDLVFLTHFHPDHCAGIPRLIMQGRYEKWKEPLRIIGGHGTVEKVTRLFEVLYHKTFLDELPYTLIVTEVEPGDVLPFGGLSLRVVRGRHMQESLAVRISGRRGSVTYSGDTLPSDDVASLAEGCDLLVHDSYYGVMPPGMGSRNHSSWAEAVEVAAKAGARRLAMLHVKAAEREDIVKALPILGESYRGEILVPDDGDIVAL
ncbi:MAG: ribonuclease Z [Candidatus Sericytochromatia bacterium]|nr:ribonuclease Z [Candidatus Tanganyikabacteria bacterium]